MGNRSESKPEENLFHKKKVNPNILSRIFLWWVCPVLVTGNKRDVEEDDLVVPSKAYSSSKQGDKFER